MSLKTSCNFTALVDSIRHDFFPRWDRERRWKIVQANNLNGIDGLCDDKTRTVKVLRGITGDKLALVLVHEICHAATNSAHGKRWQKRMEQAAHQADALDMTVVADLLRDEVTGYKASPKVTAECIYDEISDEVMNFPSADFSHILDLVRRQHGLSRADFLKQYPRTRKVYVEAVQLFRPR